MALNGSSWDPLGSPTLVFHIAAEQSASKDKSDHVTSKDKSIHVTSMHNGFPLHFEQNQRRCFRLHQFQGPAKSHT